MKETAGIFLVSKNGTILVGHPTNHSENFFSVPKGGVNKDEKLIDAAIRETYEESNVDVSDFTVIHSLTPRTH
jgi:ADP-ribose pyrophosphatase YjhB (NUDIX family)